MLSIIGTTTIYECHNQELSPNPNNNMKHGKCWNPHFRDKKEVQWISDVPQIIREESCRAEISLKVDSKNAFSSQPVMFFWKEHTYFRNYLRKHLPLILYLQSHILNLK